MFKFKQFTICQDRCAMKVGTDGVLLGAWAPLSPIIPKERLLDIGTGTGLVAIMCAQRTTKDTIIDAIEIDPSAAEQAAQNVAQTPFAERVKIRCSSLQEYHTEEKYSHIVCNPPFFINSLKCPNTERNTARHTDSLSFVTLIDYAYSLLLNNGSLSVIIPHDSVEEFSNNAVNRGFALSLFTHVYPTAQSKTPKRALLYFIKTTDEIHPLHSNLTIELSRHIYTPEYIALTKDFYQKF